MGQKVTIRL